MSATAIICWAGWFLAVGSILALLRTRRRGAELVELVNRCLHEVRRPLQVMSLSNGCGRPAGARDQAAMIRLAGSALAELDSILNGARLPDASTPVPVERLVSDAYRRWRGAAAALGVRLRLGGEGSAAGSVLGEEAGLARALDNMIANALEHGGRAPGAVVTISCGRSGRGATISVTNPCGHGPERVPPQSSHSDPRRGHGIEAARSVAVRHGGSLSITSREGCVTAALEIPASARPLPSLGPARSTSEPIVAA